MIICCCLLLLASGARALRMINLDAPESAAQGDTIQLACAFNLEAEETLYATKWYKDGREFFRFLAQEAPSKQRLPLEGIQVDITRSDNRSVVLAAVSLHTAGNFRCEVSTDAPTFISKSVERRLLVYALPSEGPRIELDGRARPSAPIELFLGERLQLACQSGHSKPAPTLDWLVNESLNLSLLVGHESSHPLFQLATRRQREQLLDSSMTKLNFTNNADLFHLARKTRVKSRPITSSGKVAGRIISGQNRAEVPTKREESQQESLRLRCVSRVLHLTMSDEIKFMLVNRTRDEVEKLAQVRPQRRSSANNGCNRSSKLASLILLLVSLFLLLRMQ